MNIIDSLPNDIHNKILNDIKQITDLRNLSLTCKLYNDQCVMKIIHLENKYLHKYSKFGFKGYLTNHCIEKFTIEIIMDGYYHLLTDKYYNIKNTIICSMLALKNKMELLNYAIGKQCLYDDYTLGCAACGGDINTFKVMIDLMPIKTYNSTVVNNVAFGGNIEILKWLCNNNYNDRFKSFQFYELLGRYGQIELLEWCNNNLGTYHIINSSFCNEAAKHNKLNIIRWAHEKEYIRESQFHVVAATNGQLNIIKWAHKHKYIKNNSFCSNAIRHGHINILQFALDNGYLQNGLLNMNISLKNCRHLNIIKWLINNKQIIVNKFHVTIGTKIDMNQYNSPEHNEKIICIDTSGELNICDLKCENNCKLLIHILHFNKHTNIENWINEKINNCKTHNCCSKYLNNCLSKK